MFNPYYARPIGSKKFENHLLALMYEGFETEQAKREALPRIPVVLKASESHHATYDPIIEGYRLLANAILSQAVIDYLDEYENRLLLEDSGLLDLAYVHECRCLTLENEYFRNEDEHSALLDGILREIVHNSDDQYLTSRLCRIRRVKRRLSAIAY